MSTNKKRFASKSNAPNAKEAAALDLFRVAEEKYLVVELEQLHSMRYTLLQLLSYSTNIFCRQAWRYGVLALNVIILGAIIYMMVAQVRCQVAQIRAQGTTRERLQFSFPFYGPAAHFKPFSSLERHNELLLCLTVASFAMALNAVAALVPSIGAIAIVFGTFPLLLGVSLLWQSSALAEWQLWWLPLGAIVS